MRGDRASATVSALAFRLARRRFLGEEASHDVVRPERFPVEPPLPAAGYLPCAESSSSTVRSNSASTRRAPLGDCAIS